MSGKFSKVRDKKNMEKNPFRTLHLYLTQLRLYLHLEWKHYNGLLEQRLYCLQLGCSKKYAIAIFLFYLLHYKAHQFHFAATKILVFLIFYLNFDINEKFCLTQGNSLKGIDIWFVRREDIEPMLQRRPNRTELRSIDYTGCLTLKCVFWIDSDRSKYAN